MNGNIAIIIATLGIYLAIVISPGPSFALISRMAMAGEKRAAFGAAFGLASGATIYAILTMVGLAVILAQIGWLARTIQLAGGLYLIWLGIQAWRGANRPLPTTDAADVSSFAQGWRHGFIMCLSNPKAIAFFIGIYAAAVPPQTALWAKGVILTGAFVIEIVWYGSMATLLSSRPIRGQYQKVRLYVERAMGLMLAAFGLKLLLGR
ncbi:MAG: LysE family transporter [Pseudomonadota bacterium]